MNINKSLNIISLLILIFSLILYSSLYFTNQINVFNSDSLLLPSFISSIINGDKVSNWVLPPGNSLFPEGLLFLIVHIFTKSVFIQYFLVNILTFTLCFIIFFKFSKSIQSSHPFAKAALIISLLIILGSMGVTPYKNMMYTTYHFGAIINLLIGLLIGTKILFESHKNQNKYLIIFFILCLISIFSDKLFIVQFLLPFIVSYLLLHRYHFIIIDKKFYGIIIIFIIAFITSILFKEIFLTNEWPSSTKIVIFQLNIFSTINHLIFQFNNFFSMIDRLYTDTKMIFIIVISTYIYFFYTLVTSIRHLTDELQIKKSFILCFILSSVFINLIAVFSINFAIHQRYFLTLSFLAVFGIIFLDLKKIYNIIIIFFIILLIAVSIPERIDFKKFKHMKLEFSHYTNNHRCLDNLLKKYDLKNGISHYVNDRYFEIFLKNKVSIWALNENLTPDYKASSKKGYVLENFDFALLDTSKNDYKKYMNSLIKMKGMARSSESCGKYQINIYKSRLN